MHPELTALWSRVRAELREGVTESIYHLWLEPLELVGIEGETLLVGAPDEIRSWVADRFARVLQTSAAAVAGPETTVQIVPLGGPVPAPAGEARAECRREPARAAETFNPKYTFDQFVIGDANRLAHAAALSVAEMPGQAYNPLFIHGSPGLGKTHLLHAVANYLALNEPDCVVRYTTVEAFTNHFIHALNARTLDHFKALYRDTDVLLIDDVQFLGSKAKTEEEFFHTFNALYETGAQLILTADRVPRELQAIEARLRERFEAGLVCDVLPPDRATRMTILRKRVTHDGVDIADERAIELIAERITANIRALEGALIRVVAFHSLTRRPIDAALVDEVLRGLYPGAAPPRRSVGEIQQAICDAFGVTLADLRSSSRTKHVAWARQVAMYLSRELTEESLPGIGRAFGRDHSTVLHAYRRTSRRMAEDPEAFDIVRGLTSRLTAPGEIRSA